MLLLTGVGFIGRNLVHYLVSNDLVEKVSPQFQVGWNLLCVGVYNAVLLSIVNNDIVNLL